MTTDYEIHIQITLRRRGEAQQTIRHVEGADEFDDALDVFHRFSNALQIVEKVLARERAPHIMRPT